MTSNEYRKSVKQEIRDLLYYGKGFTDFYVTNYMPVSVRKMELNAIKERLEDDVIEKNPNRLTENVTAKQLNKLASKYKDATPFNSPKVR